MYVQCEEEQMAKEAQLQENEHLKDKIRYIYFDMKFEFLN